MGKTENYTNNLLDEDRKGEGTTAKNLPDITMNEAASYLKTKRVIGKFIGLGILLSLFGAMILAFSQLVLRDAQAVTLNKPNDLFGIGLTIMLVLIAVSTMLFIYSGKLESSYKYMQKPFRMDNQVRQPLQNDWGTVKSKNKKTMIIGIYFCVLSLAPIIIGVLIREKNIFAIGIGVCSTILIVAISVYFMVKAANVLDAYHKLLEIENYEPTKKKARHYL